MHLHQVCGRYRTGSLKGRVAIAKYLERLEEWAHRNLTKFNKGVCRVLLPGSVTLLQCYRLVGL